MTLFPFNTGIPAAANNPSIDQPEMLKNNISTAGLIAVDHVGFGLNNGGFHNKVQLLNNAALPPALIAGEGTLYTKTVGTLSQSQLFYSPDATGNEYQLTRTKTNNFATFGTNTNISGATFGGWTFLAGPANAGGDSTAMLLQYGIATSSGTGFPNTTVIFPVPFINVPYSVQCTMIDTSGSRFFVEVFSSSITQFTATVRDSGGTPSNAKSFYWMVIGV
jgi:hypothetical protein